MYRYPLHRIMADYFLGGSGALMSGGLVALAPATPYVVVLFGGLTSLFLLYTIRTAIRHRLRIETDAGGIVVTGGQVRSIRWGEVDGLTLRYFSTRRSRKDGWMTLTLRAGGRRLALDSHLDGFETLARSAAAAAVVGGLDLDPATRSNFAALDIPLPDHRP